MEDLNSGIVSYLVFVHKCLQVVLGNCVPYHLNLRLAAESGPFVLFSHSSSITSVKGLDGSNIPARAWTPIHIVKRLGWCLQADNLCFKYHIKSGHCQHLELETWHSIVYRYDGPSCHTRCSPPALLTMAMATKPGISERLGTRTGLHFTL